MPSVVTLDDISFEAPCDGDGYDSFRVIYPCVSPKKIGLLTNLLHKNYKLVEVLSYENLFSASPYYTTTSEPSLFESYATVMREVNPMGIFLLRKPDIVDLITIEDLRKKSADFTYL